MQALKISKQTLLAASAALVVMIDEARGAMHDAALSHNADLHDAASAVLNETLSANTEIVGILEAVQAAEKPQYVIRCGDGFVYLKAWGEGGAVVLSSNVDHAFRFDEKELADGILGMLKDYDKFDHWHYNVAEV